MHVAAAVALAQGSAERIRRLNDCPSAFVQLYMKAKWRKGIRAGLLALFLVGAAAGLIGCADEYVAYPGYGGGYYASYSGYRPYYGYGYAPYRSYGPYYGSPYYGQPYYGRPYYGGATVVVSGSRNYAYRDGYRRGSYTYRDRYGRWHRADKVSSRKVTRKAVTRRTPPPRYENDEEQRYYTPR
jgi:hypothetical protein